MSTSSMRVRRNATLALAAVTALVAAPTAANASRGVVSHTVAGSAAKAKRIRQFWTPKRMRRADPIPLTKPRRSSPSFSTGQNRGEPGTIPPSLPKDNARALGTRANLVLNPSAYPYSTQGKLFVRDPVHGLGYCSATVVNTPTKSVIFSAGHCARDEGVWATSVLFVPGYKNGSRPYGSFAASWEYVTPQWLNSQNLSFDISAFVLYGNPRGKVANVVGSRGIAWNYPAYRHYVSYGYPVDPPFNGQNLYSCPSWLGGRDSRMSSPYPMWITCNMTPGSSGGGWITRIGNQDGWLNSVNSYRPRPVSQYRNRMYGPYFGNAAASLYNQVKNVAP